MSDKKPVKTDPKAPPSLTVDLGDWGKLVATSKIFSSGSCGFYANGKIANPNNGELYQVGCNITLIGSKPK